MKKIFLVSVSVLMMQLLMAQDSAKLQSCEPVIKEYPVLWQQQSAEYRALCYQAFNIAALRLNGFTKNKTGGKKPAIITDLDETILDNSYQEAELIKTDQKYTGESWKDWTDKSAATAVPGAVKFLQMAKQKGVTIFYISNRDTSEVKSTLINLQKLKLPNADTNHMLFLSNTSSKETRRQIVMKKYNVVMLLGDNLNDFMQAFEKKPVDARKVEVDKVREEWGKKFIVLPNATYGEWENAIYDYEKNLTAEQKDAKRKEKLKGYADLIK
jgi:5'-nucleotidase (lipoprotein e(P4) family)